MRFAYYPTRPPPVYETVDQRMAAEDATGEVAPPTAPPMQHFADDAQPAHVQPYHHAPPVHFLG
eukprot:6151333-Prorocentrum_lima.AAC.1